MVRALQKTNITEERKSEIISSLLGQEINGVRKTGLVDCKSENEFDRRFEDLKNDLPEAFVKWLLSKKNRIRDVLNTMKKTMLYPVRTSGGLGDPPNKFVNNRCESMNMVLKESVGHETDFVKFLEIVKEKVTNHHINRTYSIR